MATFFIKRLRPFLQEKCKWSPIGGPLNPLKANDFLDDGEVQADSVYHAWALLREQSKDLRVGDLLVAESETVFVCTYSGFEVGTWLPTATDAAPGSDEKAPGQDVVASNVTESGS